MDPNELGFVAEFVSFGSSYLDLLVLSPDARPKRIGYWRNIKDTWGRCPYLPLLGAALLMDLTALGLVHGRRTHLHLGPEDGPITFGYG